MHTDGSVTVDNLLMPPGVVLKEWYSRTNYQIRMIEPDLPLLKRGCDYQIQVYAETFPEDRLVVRLIFYNGQDTVVGTVVVEKEEDTFTVPAGTMYYTMQLIQSGFTHLEFEAITLQEIEESE